MADEKSDRLEPILMAILRLLAAEAIQGKSLTESVLLLERAGLERTLMAEICGTSPGSVRALLSQAKAQAQKKGRSASVKEAS